MKYEVAANAKLDGELSGFLVLLASLLALLALYCFGVATWISIWNDRVFHYRSAYRDHVVRVCKLLREQGQEGHFLYQNFDVVLESFAPYNTMLYRTWRFRDADSVILRPEIRDQLRDAEQLVGLPPFKQALFRL